MATADSRPHHTRPGHDHPLVRDVADNDPTRNVAPAKHGMRLLLLLAAIVACLVLLGASIFAR